jgi:hypothetical protein
MPTLEQWALKDLNFDMKTEEVSFGTVREVLHTVPKTPKGFKNLLRLLQMQAETDPDTFWNVTWEHVKGSLRLWPDEARHLDTTFRVKELDTLAKSFHARSPKSWDRLHEFKGLVPFDTVFFDFKKFNLMREPQTALNHLVMPFGDFSRFLVAGGLEQSKKKLFTEALESFEHVQSFHLTVTRKVDVKNREAVLKGMFGEKFKGVFKGPVNL